MERPFTTLVARLASRGGRRPGRPGPRRPRRRRHDSTAPLWTIDTDEVLADLFTRNHR